MPTDSPASSPAAPAAAPVPEQGQLVRLRHRHFIVQDVSAGATHPDRPLQHRVRLEALDDDQMGQNLEVIWEHEVRPVVHDALGLPRPEAWDPMARFDAFLLASRWSLSSVLGGLPLQAPFRGAIQIEEYQLEPVVRALRMPRVNLLIADDVGLGKTIEAGMVMQELLARQRVRRILIVCPASLQRQWADEMLLKFSLPFEVVDRAYVSRLRKEYGVHVNPWASFPRLITSMDFVKREAPLSSFMASLKKDRAGGLPDWDLLVVDEAHNTAPSGRKSYVHDSDRTDMMRQLLPHFEHRLFLTATPHNGFTESFTALLEMLDPLRFSRGPTFDKAQLDAVMVRRLKDDMVDALGRRRFPERKVEALPSVRLSRAERELFDTLDKYIAHRLGRSGKADRLPVEFALTLLKKRLLSSPYAFSTSIAVHQSHLADSDEEGAARNVHVVESLRLRLGEDFSDDDEKDRTEETAQAESTGFFDVTDDERRMVERLVEVSGVAAEKADSKAAVLLAWIEQHLLTDGTWNDERLIIFTEYKDTLDYLERTLGSKKGWAERVLALYGGMPNAERERIKTAFRAPPGEEPVRVLIATDTASEGLNLQDHCRYLVHWEIPWNPNRMEQRNGRIDRHGQKAESVLCAHFVYEGREDQKFLDVVVDKVRTQRADLGSVGDVIAAQVEQALRGERQHIQTSEERRKLVRAEVRAEVVTADQIRSLRHELSRARKSWKLYPDTLALVLDQALRLLGHGGLEPVAEGELDGKAWLLRGLPAPWSECRPFMQDAQGRLLRLVFDDELARDRKDLALVHLDHPLMKRALAVFRANLWSVGLHESHQLARASYRVMRKGKLEQPVIMLVARVVCTSTLGQKLHEELMLVGGEFKQGEISFADAEWLTELFDLPATHPALPKTVAQALRQLFPAHEKALAAELDRRARERDKTLRRELRERGSEEATQVRKLIDERLKEIGRRLAEMEKDRGSAQLKLFDELETEQYDRDLRWLEGRREQLQKDREDKPNLVRSRYVSRDGLHAFPLALAYILPENLVQGAR